MFYLPPRFKFRESAAIELISRVRFGIVVSSLRDELSFSHLPLLPVIEDGKLTGIRGHFARANEHHRLLMEKPDAVIIFNGPNAYLSAQWFTPGNPAAPSWNYVTVHVHGNMRFAQSEAETNAVIDDLVQVNEAELPTQWNLAGYSPERRAALVPHIIGFTLDVTRIESKFKLNQHYGDADKRSAAAGLMSRGTDASREIAELMLETCSPEGGESGTDIRDHLPGTKPGIDGY